MNSCPNNYNRCAYNDDGGGDNHDRWVYGVVFMATIFQTGLAEMVVLTNLSFSRYFLAKHPCISEFISNQLYHVGRGKLVIH